MYRKRGSSLDDVPTDSSKPAEILGEPLGTKLDQELGDEVTAPKVDATNQVIYPYICTRPIVSN